MSAKVHRRRARAQAPAWEGWLTPARSTALLIVVGIAIYFNGLFNALLWDDEWRILNNPLIRSLANWQLVLSGASADLGMGRVSSYFFRPLYVLLNMALYAIWGPNPFGYHLFQIVLHLSNGLLVFFILQRLNAQTRLALWVNTLAAGVFVAHSAIAEAVLYPSAGEVMYVFLALLGFYLMVSSPSGRVHPVRFVGAGVALVLAPLYKESAFILFPAMAFYLLLYRPQRWATWLGTLVASIGAYFLLRLALVHDVAPQSSAMARIPLLPGLLTIPLEVTSYLGLLVFPAYLAVARSFVVTKPDSLAFLFPLAFILLVAGLALFTAYRVRARLVWLGLGWSGAGLAWASTPYPPDITIAERWLYSPLVGVSFLLAGCLGWLLSHRPAWARPCLAILVLFILALGTRTFIRSFDWRDGYTLYSRDLASSSNSFYLEHNLGVELVRRGQLSEAKQRLQRAIELSPSSSVAYNSLGAIYEREGDFAQAAESFRKSINLKGGSFAYENLAKVLLAYYNDPKQAKEVTQEGLERYPYNPKLWLDLAVSEFQLGNREAALRAAERSYRLEPSEASSALYAQLAQNKGPSVE